LGDPCRGINERYKRVESWEGIDKKMGEGSRMGREDIGNW